MATITDVAQRSGLSKTTVSRVINNHPYVSDQKREAVLKAMEELGYAPNPSARRLRGQSTKTIGVIVPRIVNPFFAYLVNSIEQAAYKKGYQLLIFQSNEDKEKELDFLTLLKTKHVDGVIMTSIENDWETIQAYTSFGAIVLCNDYVDQVEVPTIRLNQTKGAYLGIKHLIERGHTRIAYCTGGLFDQQGKGKDRNVGFQQAMNEASLPINPQWIFINQHTIDDGRQTVKQLLEMKERPTAIFTGSDEVAAGVMMQAKEEGLHIPNDLAVIGFDDQPLAEILEPKLTTIRQPVDQMGERAFEVMLRVLENQEKTEENEELSIELITRQST